MIYAVVIWTILTIVCFLLGSTILNFFEGNSFTRFIEHIILSIWVGIIGLTVILLALSFLVPLSTTTGIITYTIIIIFSLFFNRNNEDIKSFINYLRPKYIGIYYLISIAVAILITRKTITWTDTGLYHWQSIKWLSNFGTVTGIGLIHSRYGFNAGWFAFSAPLNIPQLGSHVGAISNGFILLIATFHFLIAINNLLTKNYHISDWFIILYYSLIVCYYITIDSAYVILISYSPDVPVNFFVGIITWTILLIADSRKIQNTKAILNLELIPLLLSLGTITIKLTALPLLLPTFLFAIFNVSKKIKAFWVSSLLSIILLIPMFGYSIKTTGCLLYPSSVACFEVPWLIDKNVLKQEMQLINVMGGVEINPKQNYFLVMLKERWELLKSSIKYAILVILFIISIVLSGVLNAYNKHQIIKGLWYVIFLAIGGMLFILLQTAVIRFGLGYFFIIFCVFLGVIFNYNNRIINSNHSIILKNQKIYLYVFTICLITFFLANFKIKYLFIPSPLPTVKLIEGQINDVQYVYPKEQIGGDSKPFKFGLCWDAPLPCASAPIEDNIQLKDANRGISKGFINKK